jgi:hypothetical protein
LHQLQAQPLAVIKMKKVYLIIGLLVLVYFSLRLLKDIPSYPGKNGIKENISIGKTNFTLIDASICNYCLPHDFSQASYIVSVSDTNWNNLFEYGKMIIPPPKAGGYLSVLFVLGNNKNSEWKRDMYKLGTNDAIENIKLVDDWVAIYNGGDDNASKSLTQIRNGKFNGFSNHYWEDGKIWYTANFKDGKFHGEKIEYNEDYQIRENWLNGEKIKTDTIK